MKYALLIAVAAAAEEAEEVYATVPTNKDGHAQSQPCNPTTEDTGCDHTTGLRCVRSYVIGQVDKPWACAP